MNNNVPATNLWQQDDWKKILFDGNLSNNAEFKYYYGSASDLTPDVKLPTDMKFTFDKARGITSFKVYNRESGNGRMTSIKAVAHTAVSYTHLLFQFSNPPGDIFHNVKIRGLIQNRIDMMDHFV